MIRKITMILLLLMAYATGWAQELPSDTIFNPTVNHTAQTAKKYTIRGIEVTGADNYEDYVLIGFSGLSIGQTISVPGDEVTNAIKRFWRQGLFSDVRITLEKVLRSLKFDEAEAKAPEEVAVKARNAIERMLAVG